MAATKEKLNTVDSTYQQVLVAGQNFDVNAILRGIQLTVVGSARALHNPNLFRSEIYRQAWLAIGAGLVIKILVEAPVLLLRSIIWALHVFVDLDQRWWQENVVDGAAFLTKTILQLPYLLMSLLSLILINPYLDDMFMVSLEWVDRTYYAKHEADNPAALRTPYHTNLKDYPTQRTSTATQHSRLSAIRFLTRFARRTMISLVAYLFSYLPIIGRLSLPLTSFVTFKDAVGPVPAGIVFGVGILLPRQYLAAFLQTYYGSRSLVRELLRPYLRRVQFTDDQQRQFFRDREGVLFGFGIGFYILLKIPILGVLIYGIAEASTAYLITKIVSPPPLPALRSEYAAEQVEWKTKKEFLHMGLNDLDAVLKPGGLDTSQSHLQDNERTPVKKFS